MHANPEVLTRPNAASGLVSGSAAKTEALAASVCRECNQVQAEKVLECRLKLIDLFA